MQRLNTYIEKILLLITRIYDSDCAIEMQCLTSCIDILKNPYEIWRSTDYVHLFRHKNIGNKRDQNNNNNNNVNSKINNKHNSKNKLSGTAKQIPLSTRIEVQKLRIWNYILVIIATSFVATLFFSFIIIIIAVAYSNLMPSILFNFQAYDAGSALNDVLALTEIIATQPIFVALKTPNYP